MKRYVHALDKKLEKRVKRIFEKSYKSQVEKRNNNPECLQDKRVQQAIQKEMDIFMNPEHTKMSTEEEAEYDGWRGCLTKEERQEHEEDEMVQGQVNWLKYVPEHQDDK